MVLILKACELVLLILISARLIKASGYSEDFYSIPKPEIVVTTRGFRVSIPNEPGMEMFFFHGSINQEIRFLEPGTITISAKVPRNGQWILQSNDFTLKVWDTIYFWLYVKKNGMGYTRSYDSFRVTEILPYYPRIVPWSATRPPRNAIPDAEDSSTNYLVCQSENHIMKQTIIKLQAQIITLESRMSSPNTAPSRQNVPRMREESMDKDVWVWN